MEKGKKPGITYLLKELLNYVMSKEREEYLKKIPLIWLMDFIIVD
ncbi:hypothetical protein [Deferribacter autotrophicus]|nr:hypothetical protein [Deferribacter autotrophicus]